MTDQYRLEPHKHGDWRVVKVEMIDITCRDSDTRPQLIEGGQSIVCIGSLQACENFMKSIK